MKRLIAFAALWIPLAAWASGIEPAPTDTTVVVNGKRIEVKDGGDRLKVRVYELNRENEEIDDEMVFEGHYKDGKSYERRKRSINIPLPTWSREFDAHWAGFGMGFANIADGFNFNDIDGISLRGGNSLEYNLNVLEKSFLLSKNSNFAIVTGAGMRWSRYRLDGNSYLKETDGVTSLHPAPEGIHLSSSKLNITSLTIPVLLEWQNRKKRGDRFFVSAGIVGVIKTISSSKIVYRDERGKKQKEKMDGGMNLRPVTMDFMLQAGYEWIGIYAKYSPIDMFGSGKGPQVQPVSIGLHLHI